MRQQAHWLAGQLRDLIRASANRAECDAAVSAQFGEDIVPIARQFFDYQRLK